MNRTATDTDVPASIDLNADLGEGLGVWPMGDDEAMLQVVATAYIACGAHAGDPSTMRRACAGAARNDVAITAHVAYPDLLGFGRRFLDIAPSELTDQVIAQVGALRAIAAAEGTRERGVNPHGAPCNALAHHEVQAAAVLTALIELGIEGPLPLVAAPGSVVSRLADDAGSPVVLEAFTDRACTGTPPERWPWPSGCGRRSKRPTCRSRPSCDRPAGSCPVTAEPVTVRRAGEHAILAEYPDTTTVLQVAAALRGLAPPRLREVVPAERSHWQASTMRAAMPASASLPHARGS